MEEQDKNIVKIDIAGTTYTLKTDAEAEYVKKIASIINEKMESITEMNPNLPSFKIAVLCLIEIVDEMLKSYQKLNKIEKEFSLKTSDIIEKIDQRISSNYKII